MECFNASYIQYATMAQWLQRTQGMCFRSSSVSQIKHIATVIPIGGRLAVGLLPCAHVQGVK